MTDTKNYTQEDLEAVFDWLIADSVGGEDSVKTACWFKHRFFKCLANNYHKPTSFKFGLLHKCHTEGCENEGKNRMHKFQPHSDLKFKDIVLEGKEVWYCDPCHKKLFKEKGDAGN